MLEGTSQDNSASAALILIMHLHYEAKINTFLIIPQQQLSNMRFKDVVFDVGLFWSVVYVFMVLSFIPHSYNIVILPWLTDVNQKLTPTTCTCVCSWAENRAEWKFQKTRQTWLLQHMFNSEKVKLIAIVALLHLL